MVAPRRTGSKRDRIDRLPIPLYVAILLFDIILVAIAAYAILQLGDSIEDMLWPGGPEWID